MKIDFNFSLRRFGVRRPGAALAVPSLPLNCELSRLARKAISYPGDPVAKIGQSAARPGPAPALAGRSLPLNCEFKSSCGKRFSTRETVAKIGQSAARRGPAPLWPVPPYHSTANSSRLARKVIFHPGDRCEDRPKRCQARPAPFWPVAPYHSTAN